MPTKKSASAWAEVIGRVEEVGRDYIAVRIAHTIHIPEDELNRWIAKLRRGSRVGILLLDDGSIRVRVVDEADYER